MIRPSAPRILLVPDVIWGDNSGAVSARFSASLLHSCGYDVTVYAFAPQGNDIDVDAHKEFVFLPRRPSSSIHHFFGGKVLEEFRRVLDQCCPDYVFFAGSALSKPCQFYKACQERGVPYNLLFYINDYYCSRIYAGLSDGPCFRCLGGNYCHAFLNRCQNGTPRLVQFVKNALVIGSLKRAFLKCHHALGYSEDQLSLYRRFGFSTEQCVKSPVHFNNQCLSGIEPTKGEYFTLCGQSSVEKGWHRMADVIRLCPGIRFKCAFPNASIAARQLRAFHLEAFVESGQIEIVTDTKEHASLLRLQAGSRGVLVPSNYPTTGEFMMMEALGLGKPVIAFRVGAHTDILKDGENGFMTEVSDVEGFAERIRCLATDDALYDRISEGARQLFSALNSRELLEESAKRAFPAIDRPGRPVSVSK